jgi:hypothetical protein
MATLYATQPDLEPIEYTHFDCWDEVMEENNWTHFELYMDIIRSWEKSLGVTLIFEDEEPQLYGDSIWDLVVFRVLQGGYDVYVGTAFIEIYVMADEQADYK